MRESSALKSSHWLEPVDRLSVNVNVASFVIKTALQVFSQNQTAKKKKNQTFALEKYIFCKKKKKTWENAYHAFPYEEEKIKKKQC